MSNYVGSVTLLTTYTIFNSIAIISSISAIIYRIRQKIKGELFTNLLFWNAIYINLPFLIINFNPFNKFACESQAFFLISGINAQICIMPAIAWNSNHFFFTKTRIQQVNAYAFSLIFFVGNLAFTSFLADGSNMLSGYCFYAFNSPLVFATIILLIVSTLLTLLWYFQIYREIKITEEQVKTSLPTMANSPRKHRPSTFMREEPKTKHKVAGKKFLSYIFILLMWYIMIIGMAFQLTTNNIPEGFAILFMLFMPLNNILVSYYYTRIEKKKEIEFKLEKNPPISSARRATVERPLTEIKMAEPRVQIVVHNVPSSPIQPIVAISPIHLTPPSGNDDPKYKLSSRFKNLSEGSERTYRRDSVVVVYDPRSLHDMQYDRSPSPSSVVQMVSISPVPDG